MTPCRTCTNPSCHADMNPCEELEALLPSMYDGENYKIAEVSSNTPSSASSATIASKSERKQEIEEEFNHQASKAGYETRSLTPATANSYQDWEALRDLVEKALLNNWAPTNNFAASAKTKAHRLSVQFAAYMRCWTVRDIAEASNQARQTIHDQLSATLRKCGAILVGQLGLPPNKYKKTNSIKEFKDIFNQGTYK